MRKGEGSALYRASGSIAFTAAARAVWYVAEDKEDSELRLFLRVTRVDLLRSEEIGERCHSDWRDPTTCFYFGLLVVFYH